MGLSARRSTAESAAIEDIPFSMQPEGTSHERHPANPLQLHHLSRRRLRLRLPASCRTDRLRLRPPVPLRPAVPLRHAVPVRRRQPLHAILSPQVDPVPRTPTHRNSPVNSYFLAYLGGIVGAVLMDVTEALAARAGLTSGVSVALVGRWALGLLHGQWAHADITRSAARPGEERAGMAFHFLVGGGGVALLYAVWLQVTGWTLPAHRLWGGVAFGAVTSLLPWLVLLPAFGWGWFGRRAPKGSNALLASMVSHLPYGLGVGAVVALGSGL